ncbi:sugar ABC transporter ATP-binding protein [Nocardioides sp. cx-169]|uniref:sugar ABC transporter ATP-binding protein n=1 Tax=Nocardioides sp. cx-169 TaxID=2899080 RepID=UPI001E3B7FA2|nr:sugar ABC transporter ATP-binding protein [Nocardioides sp. cx-169]MCD4532701.1 sugar ABC transporter ATP-binding protein [Nocardioides sp. cx-169]
MADLGQTDEAPAQSRLPAGSGALLQMSGIVKEFSSVRALGGVDFEVRAGETHCLVGQNGAGKSTMIKILSASYLPDAGTITWKGDPARFAHPLAAIKAGIATIYQELDLVPGLTVAENIFLGHEISAGGFSRRGATNQRAREILARLGHSEIGPTRLVGELSPAGQQVVSMARALSHEVDLLILDEPSAVLDHGEVENLFRVIRGLTAQGVAIVYISHRLEEIRQIGDRITVLKDGVTVATGLPAKTTPTGDLIKLMTGRSIEYVFPQRDQEAAPDASRDPVLQVRDLALDGVFSGVDLTVRAGEIVGLAGLVGSGRTEILETIYGARRATSGTVSVDGRKLRRGAVDVAVRAGIGLAPEERKSQGLLLDQAVYANISVSSLKSFQRAGFVLRGREKAKARELVESLDVRPRTISRHVRTMSGGNQQKVVLARWLLRGCRVLLLDEPTRGVDVGARSEIYRLVRTLADSGVAVVVVSSEVEEVLGLADRVLVVREGRVVHEAAAAHIDESQVLDLVMEGTPA